MKIKKIKKKAKTEKVSKDIKLESNTEEENSENEYTVRSMMKDLNKWMNLYS